MSLRRFIERRRQLSMIWLVKCINPSSFFCIRQHLIARHRDLIANGGDQIVRGEIAVYIDNEARKAAFKQLTAKTLAERSGEGAGADVPGDMGLENVRRQPQTVHVSGDGVRCMVAEYEKWSGAKLLKRCDRNGWVACHAVSIAWSACACARAALQTVIAGAQLSAAH